MTIWIHCDRCVAEALHTVAKNDLKLDFCGHHFHEHSATLIAAGWEVVIPATGTQCVGTTETPPTNQPDYWADGMPVPTEESNEST